MGQHTQPAIRTTTPVDIAYGRAPVAPDHSILSAVSRWNAAACHDETRHARKATQDADRDEKRGQTWRATESRKKAAEHAANAVRHRLNAAECETVLVEMFNGLEAA